MKKIFIFSVLILALASCKHADEFSVSGNLQNTDEEYVYLEHLGLTKTEVLDSAKLSESGRFSFKSARPEYPELYRLRVGEKFIVLAVDSDETIEVRACADSLHAAEFKNSPKSEEIAFLRQSIKRNTPEDHKKTAQEIIMKDPKSLVAYYALYQQKALVPVFNISDPADAVYFKAVATSWNVWMPENARTKALCQQVLDQINGERHALSEAAMRLYFEQQESENFFDITMKDEFNNEQSLSSLKGKIILLDFCSIEMDYYETYVATLYAVYQKYHGKGLEIYQVYPDQNISLWNAQMQELPWITVRTANGLLDPVYTTYNVSHIPACFVYNRKGEIVSRPADFQELDEVLSSLLK